MARYSQRRSRAQYGLDDRCRSQSSTDPVGMAASQARQSRREQLDRQRASWMQQHKETIANAPAMSASRLSDPGSAVQEPTSGAGADYECPICSRVMAGADHVPTVLFPCGHTFCRSCLDRTNRPKCPFCRQAIQSRAVNVPLQAMIERRQPGHGLSTADSAADRYLSEFRALAMKKRALAADRSKIKTRLAEADAERGRLAAIADRLSSEHDRTAAELARLQERLDNVIGRNERNADAIRRIEQEREQDETRLEQIDEQLRPIQAGIDKSRLLFYNFRPDAVLSSDDDDDDGQ